MTAPLAVGRARVRWRAHWEPNAGARWQEAEAGPRSPLADVRLDLYRRAQLLVLEAPPPQVGVHILAPAHGGGFVVHKRWGKKGRVRP